MFDENKQMLIKLATQYRRVTHVNFEASYCQKIIKARTPSH